MNNKTLRSASSYSNLYDKRTVERCRDIEHQYAEEIDKEAGTIKISSFADLTMSQLLYFYTGDRYLQKEETINDWMERDKAKDTKLKEATPPENVTCDTCSASMEYKDKTFDTSDPARVIFFFKCPNNHLPHKYVYSDGTVWDKVLVLCPECDSELKEGSTKDDKEIVIEYSCTNCSYSDTDTIDLEAYEPEEDSHFAEDRKRFCLSKKAGEEYRLARRDFKQVSRLVAKWEDEDKHQEEKERADAIERLTVPHIKRKISALFEKKALEEIRFDDLETTPNCTYLKFSAEDPEATKENSYKRCLDLKRGIVRELEDTNWRLMSGGVSYRLGIMSGRLRVYESDDDVYNLVKR